jgi:hypothetical protein
VKAPGKSEKTDEILRNLEKNLDNAAGEGYNIALTKVLEKLNFYSVKGRGITKEGK